MNRSIVIDIIKESLWEKINKAVYSKDVSMEEYEELRIHALSLLPAPILPSLSIDDNLQKIWERDMGGCQRISVEQTLGSAPVKFNNPA